MLRRRYFPEYVKSASSWPFMPLAADVCETVKCAFVLAGSSVFNTAQTT
jgi:hypothetical protein